MNEALEALLQSARVWHARSAAGVAPVRAAVSTGRSRLDASLPDGGWPLGTLVELLLPATGIGELQLLLPALRTLAAESEAGEKRRWLAWIAPPHTPYPPALAQGGIRPDRLLLIAAGRVADRLWAVEQALRSDSCAAVLAWLEAVDERWLRRLKLAAEAGGALAVLFRPLRCRVQPSPAALRLALEATPGGLDVCLLKSRGSGPRWVRNALGE